MIIYFLYINKYYEKTSAGVEDRYIYLGNQRIAIVNKPNGQSPQLYLNFTDHLNSSSILTNSTGTIISLMDYYPYGDDRVNVQNGSYNAIYQFTDQEFDNEADQYYFEARYYQQNIGRFNSPDPVLQDKTSEYFFLNNNTQKKLIEFLKNPQGLNYYSYTKNNPLIYIDPTGLAEIYIREVGPKNANTYDIHNWESMGGHTMIKVGDTYWGFADLSDEKYSHDVQEFTEEQFKEYSKGQQWNVVDIGDEWDDTIKAEFEKLKTEGVNAEGGEYNIFTNNCTQKVDQILKKAGVFSKLSFTPFSPHQLLMKFKGMKLFESIVQFFNPDYEPIIKDIWVEIIEDNN